MNSYLVRHAKFTVIFGVLVLVAAGAYGAGLFKTLKSGDNFYANGSQSKAAQDKVSELYGTKNTDAVIVLFEKKPGQNIDLKSSTAANEITSLLKLFGSDDAVQSYYSTHQDSFIASDSSATFAVVNIGGASAESAYGQAKKFADTTKSDVFNISIGGSLVGRNQTQDQVKEDLGRAELISLPILALLLFVFFKSPIAAALPLSMSVLTIAGGLAVARFIDSFISIDTYSLNVITILGVGLSIDYCLLAVNRFREELARGKNITNAVEVTAKTAGRTIFYSGLTVAICLLSLLFFPVEFMHSVAIGGAAAVGVAVIISTLLLPPALKLAGNNVNKWRIGKRKTVTHNSWGRAAKLVSSHPIVSIIIGCVVIGLFVWPLSAFKTAVFDWRVLPSNQSAYHVGRVLQEKFTANTPSITVLADFGHSPSITEICQATREVKSTANVKAADTAYAQLSGVGDCSAVPVALAAIGEKSPQARYSIDQYAAKYIRGNYLRIDVTPENDAADSRTFSLVQALRSLHLTGATTEIAGTSALSKDTQDIYAKWLPIVGAVIATAMVVVLSILLGSFVIPLQAVVINSLSLLIALGILVIVFQLGWGSSLLHTTTTGGLEPSIPILAIVMAFGLSMDYAVFLYSRIHEVYDRKGDVTTSIVEGVAKTGPIISAAAVLMFVVVAAFGLSHVVLIQQIGVGLGVAVLVDAFFVRIFFVPAVMKLFGRTSWAAPSWLKKITIKHE